MNKELVEILKCISKLSYFEKIDICGVFDESTRKCLDINCDNCILCSPENNFYKPYLIKL